VEAAEGLLGEDADRGPVPLYEGPPDAAGQRARLLAFEAAHPDVDVAAVGSEAQAAITVPDGTLVLRRDTYAALFDVLDLLFPTVVAAQDTAPP
jgi:hypothetical protein